MTPEDQDRVLEAWSTQDLATILTIYNERKVTPTRLPPCCATEQLMAWTNYAIKTNQLRWTTERNDDATKDGS